jgi:hypothetical protein
VLTDFEDDNDFTPDVSDAHAVPDVVVFSEKPASTASAPTKAQRRAFMVTNLTGIFMDRLIINHAVFQSVEIRGGRKH